jgi:type IX secretion system PorP/SprF family membrane protein
MNRTRLFFWLAVMLTGTGFRAAAQDVHFSQYYANPVYLNPALAGTNICPRVVTNFRQQWPALGGKYTSYSASFDQYFDKIHGGIGVIFLGDHAAETGHITTNAVSVIYSFRARLTRDNKAALLVALQGTCQMKHLDFNKLTFEDMIDPKYGFVYHTQENFPTFTKVIADFSAGIAFYSEHYFGGIAVNHFTQPRESFYDNKDTITRLPLKLTANFGTMINLTQQLRAEKTLGDFSLSPNVIFQYQSRFVGGAVYTTVNYGMYVSCYPMMIGAWFRQGFKNFDAVIFSVGLEQKILKIGYSYDFTIPSNKEYKKPLTGGSHEVSAQFYFPCPQKNPRIPHLVCPRF